MKRKTNPRVATWLALAMGITAAASVEAATVQITLNQSYTPSSPAGFIDVTGDTVTDNVMVVTSTKYVRLERQGEGVANLQFAMAYYHLFAGSTGTRTTASLLFTDLRINGGAPTSGYIQGDYFASPSSQIATAVRLVFDDASTAAPTGTLAASYPEFVPASTPATSAVPEASTSLGLLALGAGGLLTRRRTSRKA